ncbi:MAG: type III toxin-antitoxin system ToxN/AbiQ family toxin [Candidatus Izemoplasma sp.]|nr:type III toxin-antitoxin system ToxN/AbiQ family toxin [Candidatus Izemoplasma sp.]
MVRVKDKYIKHLRKIDNKVPKNYNQKRPYVGVLITINGYNYFAPLSSPKNKHKKMSNSMLDVFKIKQGEYGIVNLNNMIPVHESQIIEFDFNNEDYQYRLILINQYIHLKKGKNQLERKARVLYEKVKNGHQISERCCDFEILEDACSNFKK